jgi:hypothetical protein
VIEVASVELEEEVLVIPVVVNAGISIMDVDRTVLILRSKRSVVLPDLVFLDAAS